MKIWRYIEMYRKIGPIKCKQTEIASYEIKLADTRRGKYDGVQST